MLRRVVLALCALACASCGDKGPESTTFEGSVSGTTFQSPTAIFADKKNRMWRDQLAILISDDPDACGHLAYDDDQERPFLKLPDGSHAPSLWLKMTDRSPIFTDMRGIGDDLHADFDPGAPAGDDCGSASCQVRWLAAKRGSVLIEASDPSDDTGATARGSYAIDFGGGNLASGDFRAVPCNALKAEGCSAVSGGALPLAGLLSLLALRRRRR